MNDRFHRGTPHPVVAHPVLDSASGLRQAHTRATAPGERLYTVDGLRGAAALVVVAGHLIDWIGRLPMPRNYLAVDLFFLMSGFVLGCVYEPRFAGGWTTRRFLLNRYVRLYPLYLLGTLLGVAAGLVALLIGKSSMGATGLAIATVAGILMLPSPTWDKSGAVMPLDNPGWSLHFELVANIVFALARRWLNTAVLTLGVLVFGAWLIRGYVTHHGFDGSNWKGFAWGYVRVGYSFLLGLLMHRIHPGRRWRSDAAWLPLLAALFVMLTPYPNGWFFDGAAVLVLFPIILWVAVLVEPRHPSPFTWLGLLSYPLYVTHSPVQHMVERAGAILHVDPAHHAPVAGLAFLAAMVAAALLLDRFFDVPIRRWLTARLSPRPRADRAAEAIDTAL